MKSIPSDFFREPNHTMRHLDLSFNFISSVSGTIRNMKALEFLSLKSNELESLPTTISQMERLTEFEIEWGLYQKPVVSTGVYQSTDLIKLKKIFQWFLGKSKISISFNEYRKAFSDIYKEPGVTGGQEAYGKILTMVLDAIQFRHNGVLMQLVSQFPETETNADLRSKQDLICISVERSNSVALELFLSKGICPRSIEKLIFEAINQGDIKMLHLLLKAKEKHGLQCDQSTLPLPLASCAIRESKKDREKGMMMLKMLIESGIDIFEADLKGRTALHFAVEFGMTQIYETLKKIEPQREDSSQRNEKVEERKEDSLLHLAAKSEKIEMILKVLELGESFDLSENQNGKTPIDLVPMFLLTSRKVMIKSFKKAVYKTEGKFHKTKDRVSGVVAQTIQNKRDAMKKRTWAFKKQLASGKSPFMKRFNTGKSIGKELDHIWENSFYQSTDFGKVKSLSPSFIHSTPEYKSISPSPVQVSPSRSPKNNETMNPDFIGQNDFDQFPENDKKGLESIPTMEHRDQNAFKIIECFYPNSQSHPAEHRSDYLDCISKEGRKFGQPEDSSQFQMRFFSEENDFLEFKDFCFVPPASGNPVEEAVIKLKNLVLDSIRLSPVYLGENKAKSRKHNQIEDKKKHRLEFLRTYKAHEALSEFLTPNKSFDFSKFVKRLEKRQNEIFAGDFRKFRKLLVLLRDHLHLNQLKSTLQYIFETKSFGEMVQKAFLEEDFDRFFPEEEDKLKKKQYFEANSYCLALGMLMNLIKMTLERKEAKPIGTMRKYLILKSLGMFGEQCFDKSEPLLEEIMRMVLKKSKSRVLAYESIEAFLLIHVTHSSQLNAFLTKTHIFKRSVLKHTQSFVESEHRHKNEGAVSHYQRNEITIETFCPILKKRLSQDITNPFSESFSK